MSTKHFLCGDTLKVRWVNSGVSPSVITAKVYDGTEAVVDSSAMVESGSGLGHYYHLHTVPNTPGWYVAETIATIVGKPYKNRERYRAVLLDVN